MFIKKIPLIVTLVIISIFSQANATFTIKNQTKQPITITEEFDYYPPRTTILNSGQFDRNFRPNAKITISYQHNAKEKSTDFVFRKYNFSHSVNYNLFAEIERSNTLNEDIALINMLRAADPLFIIRDNFFGTNNNNILSLVCISEDESSWIYANNTAILKSPLSIETYSNPWLEYVTEKHGKKIYKSQIQNENQPHFDEESKWDLSEYSRAVLILDSNNPTNSAGLPIAIALQNWFTSEDNHTITQRFYKTDKFHNFPAELVLRNLNCATIKKLHFLDAYGAEIPNYLMHPTYYYGLYIEFSIPGFWYNPEQLCNRHGSYGILGLKGSYEIGFSFGSGNKTESLSIQHCAFIPLKSKPCRCFHDASIDKSIYDVAPMQLYTLNEKSLALFLTTGSIIKTNPEVTHTNNYLGGKNLPSFDDEDPFDRLEGNPNDDSFLVNEE